MIMDPYSVTNVSSHQHYILSLTYSNLCPDVEFPISPLANPVLVPLGPRGVDFVNVSFTPGQRSREDV